MTVKSNTYFPASIPGIFLVFSMFMINDFALGQIYGLKFQSHNVLLDKRTELDLSPKGFLKFQAEFEISFDYNIYLSRPENYSELFGYILRVISSENNNIDLVISHSDKINLNLINGKNNSFIQVGTLSNPLDDWVNLRIKFLLREDRLILYTPDTFIVQENIHMKKDNSFKIIFGANDYRNFKTSDVPPMILKDIRISENGNLTYYWPLDEVKGNIAEDRLNKKVARVKNPSWLKSNHQKWEPRYRNEMNDFILFASDNENGRIFLLGDKELFIYSAQENSLKSIKYKDKPFSLNANYTSVYNNVDKKIYCIRLNDRFLYSLDVVSAKWNKISVSSASESTYRHCNTFFNPEENSIYFFNGYGQYTYHNDIIKLDLSKNEWQVLSNNMEIIPPRYLAGIGSLNDTIYILGGFGSITGSQMINPQSFFDMWGYSIKNQTIFKKNELEQIYDDMCVAQSFWINSKNRDYYALIFEKNKFESTLQLIKGNLGNSNLEIVGDKLPYEFFDIKSNAQLFYFPKQNKLFACTSFAHDSSTTRIGIYSIDYPPNKQNIEILNDVASKSLLFKYLTILFVILSGFLSWYFIRIRRSKGILLDTIDANKHEEVKVFAKLEEYVFDLPIEKPNYQLILFGGFQVFNLKYEDITIKFSPLLKELFLLILLHTHKNDKGISSEKISEYLWFDKSETSARNNRAVNIAKLKTILTEIGEIELTKKTGYWKIICNPNTVKCDYLDFLKITSSRTNLTQPTIFRLLEITKQGAFLPNSSFEWLDDFKSEVSDKIIDTLLNFAEKCDLAKDAEFIIKLADCIFNFDKSNENALMLKCKAEYKLGKHSLAKNTYEKFIKEYQNLYGEDYKISFNDILKS
jgi:two-component SAPR family response regulator